MLCDGGGLVGIEREMTVREGEQLEYGTFLETDNNPGPLSSVTEQEGVIIVWGH